MCLSVERAKEGPIHLKMNPVSVGLVMNPAPVGVEMYPASIHLAVNPAFVSLLIPVMTSKPKVGFLGP